MRTSQLASTSKVDALSATPVTFPGAEGPLRLGDGPGAACKHRLWVDEKSHCREQVGKVPTQEGKVFSRRCCTSEYCRRAAREQRGLETATATGQKP